jgi:hypothetical protein
LHFFSRGRAAQIYNANSTLSSFQVCTCLPVYCN